MVPNKIRRLTKTRYTLKGYQSIIKSVQPFDVFNALYLDKREH